MPYIPARLVFLSSHSLGTGFYGIVDKNIGKRLIKSPKIFFYDTALVCFLLNIEEEKHLTVHPLKGHIFENLAILEALKSRFNRGRRNNLMFYRDSNGNEVDLIHPLPVGSLPVKIKLASTFNPSLLKGTKAFSSIEECPRGTWLVYQGETRKQGETNILNLEDFTKELSLI